MTKHASGTTFTTCATIYGTTVTTGTTTISDTAFEFHTIKEEEESIATTTKESSATVTKESCTTISTFATKYRSIKEEEEEEEEEEEVCANTDNKFNTTIDDVFNTDFEFNTTIDVKFPFTSTKEEESSAMVKYYRDKGGYFCSAFYFKIFERKIPF